MKKYTFVANWKMNLSCTEAIEQVQKHRDQFLATLSPKNTQVVICPSFESLYPLQQLFDQTPVSIGAQDCSPYAPGSYTGQVSAASLKMMGCEYGIIGHSERRAHNYETDEEIAEKGKRLIEHGIHPIFCFGETLQEYEGGETFTVLERQLRQFLTILSKTDSSKTTLYLAYEPVWAIGTGRAAENEQIEQVFSWVSDMMSNICSRDLFRVLYGGSVSTANVRVLKKIKELDGFLIGKASLDFQELKKIIDYTVGVN